MAQGEWRPEVAHSKVLDGMRWGLSRGKKTSKPPTERQKAKHEFRARFRRRTVKDEGVAVRWLSSKPSFKSFLRERG